MLSKDDFAKDPKLRRHEVTLDTGGSVLLRELSVGERLAWRKKYLNGSEPTEEQETDISLSLIAVSLCNPDGSAMFSLDELADAVDLLKRRPPRDIRALQQGVLTLGGISEEAMEQAVGNSIEIPNDFSSSGSHGISDTPVLATSLKN